MIFLALASLRRVIRHRSVLLALFGLAAACGIFRVLLPHSLLSLALVWGCPILCGAVAWTVVSLQRALDDVCGLTDALRNTPAGRTSLAGSRFLAAAALSLAPTALMILILVLR
ncbi:MAG: hypothetical protein ACP5R5_02735 [Armatimonadota bacterium]